MSFHVRTVKHYSEDRDTVAVQVVMSASDAVALGRLLQTVPGRHLGVTGEWADALGALGTTLFDAGSEELKAVMRK